MVHLVDSFDHGDVENVRAALGAFEHIFAAHIWNSDHGQHPGAGGHAAQVGRLSKGDVAVFHLDPNRLVAQMRADLEKNGIVKIDSGAEEGLAAVSLDSLLQAIHGVSPNWTAWRRGCFRLAIQPQSVPVEVRFEGTGKSAAQRRPTARSRTLPMAPMVYSFHG